MLTAPYGDSDQRALPFVVGVLGDFSGDLPGELIFSSCETN